MVKKGQLISLTFSILFLSGSLIACASAGANDATPVAPPTASTGGPQPGKSTPSAQPAVPATETVDSPSSPTPIVQAPATPAAPTTAGATPARVQATATRAVAPTQVNALPGAITLPAGFGISVFASALASPRNMVIGPDGQLYAAERGAGRIIRLPDLNHDGIADGVQVVASGFERPSSVAFFKDGSLYISTPTEVYRLSQPNANGVFQKRDLMISGLPSAQGHFTRTLAFSPDWSALYIQVGSSCNTCEESDSRRATILRYNPDGSGGEIYARGLRNAVGLTFRPGTNELWASNNGSDNLGEDQPPDTVQIVQQGQDYGWPRCHAGTIVDPQFGSPGACNGIVKPLISIQAHSAVLGLTFYSGKQFPSEYSGDLFLALHGSIYRAVPTGYKIVRVHFTNGQPGAVQDFATGWLTGGHDWGRPVDIVVAPDGSLLVSDDHAGSIYRIFYHG